jgi:N-acetylmuramoyl-L-alanine amidase
LFNARGGTSYRLIALLIILAITAILWWLVYGEEFMGAKSVMAWSLAGKTVVIDPGHGGADPGVVDQEGLVEKDINLQISRSLAEILRQAGATVIMTRENDAVDAASKKADLDKRLSLMTDSDSSICISIHANSFPAQPNVYGAQVFYGAHDEKGQILANYVQKQLTRVTKSDRKALAHPSAYLLKNNEVPLILVEVGFFSNEKEKKLLQDPEYRWQLAWAVYSGTVEYFSQ